LESRNVAEIATGTKNGVPECRQTVAIIALQKSMEGARIADLALKALDGELLCSDLFFERLDPGIGVINLLRQEQDDFLELVQHHVVAVPEG
jgi:hypothetical protein